jgi:hypothetical protein
MNMDLQTIYFGMSLSDWVTLVHTYLCKQCGMHPFKIESQDYAYDSYAAVISIILANTTDSDILAALKDKQSINKYIDLAHSAWTANYIHWKRVRADTVGKNPKKTLNTYDRNDRATTSVDNLSEDDREMYQGTIKAIFGLLSKKLLEVGMQQLSI